MENINSDKNNNWEDLVNWKSLGFFSAEDYLVYIFKKTEKITSALYLISSLLKDEEPIKWELRDKGMDLITASFNASSTVPGDRNFAIQSIFSSALETISLLNVAKVSHLISEMNHRVLLKEIDQVVGMLKERLMANAENAGYVLSESFFKTPDMSVSGFKNDIISDKRHGDHKSKNTDIKDISDVSGEKKNGRQNSILMLLKGHNGLTIKDFSRVIKDCSEKTIQRDLLDLVSKGIVKKEGERRWSKYSLTS
jgi:DNA-binding HxlR family transcriptional regulator